MTLWEVSTCLLALGWARTAYELREAKRTKGGESKSTESKNTRESMNTYGSQKTRIGATIGTYSDLYGPQAEPKPLPREKDLPPVKGGSPSEFNSALKSLGFEKVEIAEAWAKVRELPTFEAQIRAALRK